MSFADEEELNAFVARDSLLAMPTEAVATALNGFPLKLAPGKDMAWLAMATRRALGISLKNIEDGPDRTSLSAVRKDLDRLAETVGEAWVQLFQRDGATDSRLWDVAWRNWDGEGGNVSEPLEYRRFNAALAEMDWLAGFIRRAAMETDAPKGNWRIAERKRIRIERAHCLAPIFEAGFGRRVTANNHPSGTHRKPSPFMDFYERMIILAFGREEIANLAEVVKAGCKRHRQFPWSFGEFIPGL